MRSRRTAGMLLVLVGFVFLVLAFSATPRNSAFLALGVVFVILGSANIRRARRA